MCWHTPKTMGVVRCTLEKRAATPPPSLTGGATYAAAAVACMASGVVTTAMAVHHTPSTPAMAGTLVTHRTPRWRPYPAHHCPVPHPPAPVCTTGQGVGTPPVPSLYSVPLHRLWRRRCAAACGGAPPGVSTPPHAAQVAPPTAVCAHMCILKQVQKGLKKQPYS